VPSSASVCAVGGKRAATARDKRWLPKRRRWRCLPPLLFLPRYGGGSWHRAHNARTAWLALPVAYYCNDVVVRSSCWIV